LSKKLTSLELQTILDECQEVRYRTHSSWLGGIVTRINRLLATKPCKGNCSHEHGELATGKVQSGRVINIPIKLPPSKPLKVITGNDVGSEESCKT
jgi:hypothetical protein